MNMWVKRDFIEFNIQWWHEWHYDNANKVYLRSKIGDLLVAAKKNKLILWRI